MGKQAKKSRAGGQEGGGAPEGSLSAAWREQAVGTSGGMRQSSVSEAKHFLGEAGVGRKAPRFSISSFISLAGFYGYPWGDVGSLHASSPGSQEP